MIPHNVIFGGRQCGKTYTAMTEIHQLVVLGRGREVLVVFPNLNYLNWWVREWNARFPHSPMVDYVSANSTQRARGRRYSKIYVEDIDAYSDGIYDHRLQEMQYGLRSPYGDEEMIYTCSPNQLNNRTHNKLTTSQQLLAQRLADAKYKRHVALIRALLQEASNEEA